MSVGSSTAINDRTDWIDICKGLGISAIVLGHAQLPRVLTQFVFLFHVPLFFFLSGYLHKPRSNFREFFRKKVVHLLLPYTAFLSICATIQSLKVMHGGESLTSALADWLWGGTHLRGFLAVFWFITCLFLTQQVMNWMIVKLTTRQVVVTVALFLAAGYLNSIVFRVTLPLDANVVLGACPFFLAGYAFRRYGLPRWAPAVSITLAAASMILIVAGVGISYDMKFANYGIPILSLVLSLGCIHSVILLSKLLLRFTILAPSLSAIGTASMGIMYLHELAINRLQALHVPRWPTFALALTLSWLGTKILGAGPFTRTVFLGVTEAGSKKESPQVAITA